MDPITLAAASALVGAMATDGWAQARDATVALWRRVWPERAEAVAAELELARPRVLAARERHQEDREQALVAGWRVPLEDLLDRDPALAADIRRLVDEQLAPLLPKAEQSRVCSIVQNVTTTGHSRATVAGRDVTVNRKNQP
ncbi:hypothetical protein [Streptomyces sp. NPDC088794]|uniref:hypothetical protein n=1 Tax=Streptomyces sp. NPDC088794 TaxID=3365902 RepID=UPI00382F6B6C